MFPHTTKQTIDGKSPVVLLTGGGSGIGLATATELLSKYKCKIHILTLEPTDELLELEKQFNDALSITYGDATQENVIDCAISECVTHFGYVTHLISCIGTMLPVAKVRDVTLSAFRRGYEINVFTVVALVQKALPILDRSPIPPTIIIVSSGVDSEVLYTGWSNYCSTKAALTRFIHVLAHEEKGINVYGVLPAVTKSPMVDMVLNGKYDSVMLPEERQKFEIWDKVGKIESAEYIADSISKTAMGLITKDSEEVRRKEPVIFVESLFNGTTKE